MSSVYAQEKNLVSNGGFEVLDSCVIAMKTPSIWPYVPIQITTPWDTLKSGGGLGYINHRCFYPNPSCGVPYNLSGGGYQYPRNGNGYVYFGFFKLTPNPSINWRWYIQQKMKQKLTAGKTYCVTYWANLVNYSNYAVDELGAYFDDGSIQSIGWLKEAPANPQVKSPSGVFYADTLNWMKVQGTFTANGTEEYITLGNFRLNAATTYTSLDGNTAGTALYFVDDVSVLPTDLPAYAGPDKSYMVGDSAFIGRPSEIGLDDDCFWYKLPNQTTAMDTVAGLWVKPLVTTTYVVKQNICGTVKWDTVVVTPNYVGINEHTWLAEQIRLAPNPASQQIQIYSPLFTETDHLKLTLTNALGQVVREEDITLKNQQVVLNTADLPDGVYSVQGRLEGKGNFVKRVLIQH